MTEPLLKSRTCGLTSSSTAAVVRSVDGVSFDGPPPDRTVCIVGESGSASGARRARSCGLVDKPGRIAGGRILWRARTGEDIDLTALARTSEAMRQIRGGEIAMVFQEPMASLSPMYTIGAHLVEAIRLHRDVSHAQALGAGPGSAERVGIPRPEER